MTTTQITEAPTPVSYLSLTGGNMEAGDIATFPDSDIADLLDDLKRAEDAIKADKAMLSDAIQRKYGARIAELRALTPEGKVSFAPAVGIEIAQTTKGDRPKPSSLGALLEKYDQQQLVDLGVSVAFFIPEAKIKGAAPEIRADLEGVFPKTVKHEKITLTRKEVSQ